MAKRQKKEQRPPTSDAPASPDPSDCDDHPAATVSGTPVTETPVTEVKGIPRVISLIVLLAIVLLISVLFFRVMASFIVPLFLAAVLAVVFKPLHQWSLRVTGKRPHRSALLTTTIVSLVVLVPTVLLSWRAYVETSRIVRVLLPDDLETLSALGDDAFIGDAAVLVRPPAPDATAETPGAEQDDESNVDAAEESSADADAAETWLDRLTEYASWPLKWYTENIDDQFDVQATLNLLARYSAQQAVKLGFVGISSLIGFVIGMGIMIFALYYFFADGPSIIETVMHLSPLDDEYERELLLQFASVSRAVVVATILSAVVQGLLAGVGYYFALDANSPVFLLTVLTMLLAIVPFVGATAVWIPVALWVFFVQNDFWPGILLALYGGGIVSTIDNVIKPWVLHGQSNLHPLLALLSILGGIQLLGPVGILVGPMLVAFMQALLGMLRRELDSFQHEDADSLLAAD